MPNDQPTTYNILFVCTGNTCRSPLAEVITRRALALRGWDHVHVDSAGTSAVWDAPASAGSLAAAAEIGLDLSGHRSQPLTRELVQRADIILGMTPSHVHAVEAMGEDAKVSLLSETISGPEAGEPIADPIGGAPQEYAEARDRISRAVAGLLERLSAILSP
ncbi:MAG: low molecular weight phosphatase family protein [Gemmatimonadota bacterium]|nr:MAG: low molecular weight phosphatase family protein [Gemmatimonadota bacterium]